MAKKLNCICIDFSRHSEEAFNWYVENYHDTDDIAGLLHVHQMPDMPFMVSMEFTLDMGTNFERITNASLQESRQLIEKFENKCKELDIEYKILAAASHYPAPGYKLCEVAKQNHASSIIMGQRGQNSIRKILLGSTSDYVVHHAHIPVTVVPPKEKQGC